MNKLEKLYFNWLVNAVVTKEEREQYSMVLMRLFEYEFISYSEYDDNLKENCLLLRDEYCNFSKTAEKLCEIYGDLDFYPTILEVMVYLASRIETTIMSNSDYGDRTSLWFWMMMESLGLIKYDNLHYDESKISQKLENFVERQYEKDGYGGLFTVENRRTDARQTDIWTQAMDFVTDFAKNNGELL